MTHRILTRTGRSLLAVLAGALILSGCSSVKVVDSWEADQPVTEKPEKVAVIAVLPDALMREAFEVDIAKILADKGTPAVASSRLPGMSGGIRGEIDTEAATGLLRKAGVDGVIVMFYAGGGSSEGYVRADYWAEFVGSGVGYTGYNWGQPYFVDVYAIRQGPGWADYQRTAYVETSYYDLDTKQPVWRFVTFTKDLEHSDTASEIAKEVASEMKSVRLN
ncbi:MAG: hypothetical protein PVJ33_03730 [Lysobacterales bacterium]|jgi:hypothetical protein